MKMDTLEWKNTTYGGTF